MSETGRGDECAASESERDAHLHTPPRAHNKPTPAGDAHTRAHSEARSRCLSQQYTDLAEDVHTHAEQQRRRRAGRIAYGTCVPQRNSTSRACICSICTGLPSARARTACDLTCKPRGSSPLMARSQKDGIVESNSSNSSSSGQSTRQSCRTEAFRADALCRGGVHSYLYLPTAPSTGPGSGCPPPRLPQPAPSPTLRDMGTQSYSHSQTLTLRGHSLILLSPRPSPAVLLGGGGGGGRALRRRSTGEDPQRSVQRPVSDGHLRAPPLPNLQSHRQSEEELSGRVAEQLRVIGDEMNEIYLQRRDEMQLWQNWRGVCRELFNFLTETLSTLYLPGLR
ncbi:bcl-2-binding component 3 isoform X2 [Amia ocellicauda]|uniref:bcl-2-binding component 3 isoform X2 n=1 Tax=Amia ocellicauda TaxID=2972642 RepID=UPI0034647C3C